MNLKPFYHYYKMSFHAPLDILISLTLSLFLMAGLAMASFFFGSARADEEVRDLNKKYITNVKKEELREIETEKERANAALLEREKMIRELEKRKRKAEEEAQQEREMVLRQLQAEQERMEKSLQEERKKAEETEEKHRKEADEAKRREEERMQVLQREQEMIRLQMQESLRKQESMLMDLEGKTRRDAEEASRREARTRLEMQAEIERLAKEKEGKIKELEVKRQQEAAEAKQREEQRLREIEAEKERANAALLEKERIIQEINAKHMHEAEEERRLREEEIRKLQAIQEEKLQALRALELGDDSHLRNLAVCGVSGQGKSTLVNAILQCPPDEPAALVEGRAGTEGTTAIQRYVVPNMQAIAIYDIPGGATTAHPSSTYWEDKHLAFFDAIILLAYLPRPIELDVMLIREALKPEEKAPIVIVFGKWGTHVTERAKELLAKEKECRGLPTEDRWDALGKNEKEQLRQVA
jgi:chemotaxis protein histidine kinase CheA